MQFVVVSVVPATWGIMAKGGPASLHLYSLLQAPASPGALFFLGYTYFGLMGRFTCSENTNCSILTPSLLQSNRKLLVVLVQIDMIDRTIMYITGRCRSKLQGRRLPEKNQWTHVRW